MDCARVQFFHYIETYLIFLRNLFIVHFISSKKDGHIESALLVPCFFVSLFGFFVCWLAGRPAI